MADGDASSGAGPSNDSGGAGDTGSGSDVGNTSGGSSTGYGGAEGISGADQGGFVGGEPSGGPGPGGSDSGAFHSVDTSSPTSPGGFAEDNDPAPGFADQDPTPGGSENPFAGPVSIPNAPPVEPSLTRAVVGALRGDMPIEDAVTSAFLGVIAPASVPLGLFSSAMRALGLDEDPAGPPPDSVIGDSGPEHGFTPPPVDSRPWPVAAPGTVPAVFLPPVGAVPAGNVWTFPAAEDAPEDSKIKDAARPLAIAPPAGWPMIAAAAGLFLLAVSDG